MTAKEFLQGDGRINVSGIAERMWPSNKDAKTYLYKKLKGERPWTAKDEKKALEVLKQLSIDLPKSN